jgi:prevent-host-death family protein
MEVSVRKLKDHLSEYLRRVQRGEAVTVTDHGRPVAVLIAVSPNRSPAERLAQLEATGEVTPPTRDTFARVRRTKVRGRSVSSSLLSDRG